MNDRHVPFAFGALLLLGGVAAIVVHGPSFRASAQAAASTESAGQEAATFELMGTLPRSLRESSGIAISRSHPGYFWTHNDSGSGASVYAVNEEGSVVARYRLNDAGSRDWEDIALGPCPASFDEPGSESDAETGADAGADVGAEPGTQAAGAPACLYVADTGNNSRDRRRLSIYIVREPDPSAGTADDRLSERVEPVRMRFEYPDSRRDSEALAVTPDGDLLVVNRGRHRRINVYRIPAEKVEKALEDGETVEAELTGPVPFDRDRSMGRVVTGATYLADEDQLVVRTYTSIWKLARTDEGWMSAGVCDFGWKEPAGEAIDAVDGTSFVVTSEAGGGAPALMHRVRCEFDG